MKKVRRPLKLHDKSTLYAMEAPLRRVRGAAASGCINSTDYSKSAPLCYCATDTCPTDGDSCGCTIGVECGPGVLGRVTG